MFPQVRQNSIKRTGVMRLTPIDWIFYGGAACGAGFFLSIVFDWTTLSLIFGCIILGTTALTVIFWALLGIVNLVEENVEPDESAQKEWLPEFEKENESNPVDPKAAHEKILNSLPRDGNNSL